jgi:O-Antigen ligase
MTGLLMLGLALAVLAVLGVLALDLLIRRVEVGAALLLASAVIDAVFVSNVPSVMAPGGTRIEVTDVVATLVVAAALARLLRAKRFAPFQRWLLLLGALLMVSLVRGVAAFGTQTSVNDFRHYMFFVGGAVYAATFSAAPRVYDRIGKTWLVMSVPMLILIALRWLAVFGVLNVGVPMEQFGNDAVIKVVDGPYAFFLGVAAVLTIPAWQVRDRRSRWVRVLSVIVLIFVLMLNRRTVWVAMVVGLAVLMLRDRRLGRRAIWLVVAVAVVAVGLFVVLSGEGGGGKEPVAQSASATGTLAWRIEGWSELVTTWSKNPANWFVGEPFGSSFARKIEGSEVTSHPHDFYIETMLRTGIVGLVALLAVTAGLLRRLWRVPARGRGLLLGPDVFPALLTMQLIWFITWIPGVEQGLVIGLGLGLAISLRGRAPSLKGASAGGPHQARPRQTAIPAGPAIQHLRQR